MLINDILFKNILQRLNYLDKKENKTEIELFEFKKLQEFLKRNK